jgi:hypothetical protein
VVLHLGGIVAEEAYGNTAHRTSPDADIEEYLMQKLSSTLRTAENDTKTDATGAKLRPCW